MVSFRTGNPARSRAIVDALRCFTIAVSSGGVASQASMPCLGSHASIPKEARTLPEDLVRLSVGVEDPADLLEDLQQALRGRVEVQC